MTWRDRGILYGYPNCCVTWFERNFKSVFFGTVTPPVGPWTGTGFIPCAECAKKIGSHRRSFLKFIAEQITPNRKYPKPFPLDEEDE